VRLEIGRILKAGESVVGWESRRRGEELCRMHLAILQIFVTGSIAPVGHAGRWGKKSVTAVEQEVVWSEVCEDP